MPLFIVALLVALGFGWFVRHETHAPAPSPATMSPARADGWAEACRERLAYAAAEFARGDACAGSVAVSALPSGVAYVEYDGRGEDGASYQVAVTEEPDEPGQAPGWHGAPGCRGYDRGFEVVRHDHGRLARVYASGGSRGLAFARTFEAAADFCVERAE
jgi:hypothetical protein